MKHDYFYKIDRIFYILDKQINIWNFNAFLPHRITPSQYMTLKLLKNRSYRIGELSRIQGVNINTMSEIISRLCKKCFIYKKKDLQDKRNVKVYLTELGKAVFEEISRYKKRHILKILKGLKEKEKRKFLQTIDFFWQVIKGVRP